MGADILMFKAHKVPVGRDQIQHIEMARDMAASFNHLYGEHFVLPEAVVEESVALLPGLDGRKMSKSYDNTIPLFAPRAQIRKQINGIVTDSRAPGEPKATEGSALFQIYQAFANAEETAKMAKAFSEGIAWGDAKQLLFERVDREIAPMRATYEDLVQNPIKVEKILNAGAEKARIRSAAFMAELRQAVGLRPLSTPVTAKNVKVSKAAAASFKQYREKDGQFYFKLVDPQGAIMLQSRGFTSPRDAGLVIGQLIDNGISALLTLEFQIEMPPLASHAELTETLNSLRETSKN
jgi:tryptophanyl-tRNA synthetase